MAGPPQTPMWEVQDAHPLLLPAQQQDDLGAAFQTWMDTSGMLRAEVLAAGALSTWSSFWGNKLGCAWGRCSLVGTECSWALALKTSSWGSEEAAGTAGPGTPWTSF